MYVNATNVNGVQPNIPSILDLALKNKTLCAFTRDRCIYPRQRFTNSFADNLIQRMTTIWF